MSRILVVDDSAVQAHYLASILREAGHTADLASSGEEALTRVGAQAYDLVMSDVNMPGMDGYQLCRLLRAHGSNVPLILLTTLDQPRELINALGSGADNFIAKPYSPARLLARVDALLARPPTPRDGSELTRVPVHFGGEQLELFVDPPRVIDLLFSSFEEATLNARELEAKRRELATIVDNISDGVVVADRPTRELLGDAQLLREHRLELPFGFTLT